MFSRFEMFGNIWDNVTTQLKEVYNIGLVVFIHFISYIYLFKLKSDIFSGILN